MTAFMLVANCSGVMESWNSLAMLSSRASAWVGGRAWSHHCAKLFASLAILYWNRSQSAESAGIVATLKHFAGYSASRGARNHGPVGMGRRELLDMILPSFETAVAAGARSVMNSVDVVPVTAT